MMQAAVDARHRADFDGRYYQLKEARCEPKPVQKPYPPIVIGGSGEQLTLRIVAQYADVWNFAGGPVETFQHKTAVLDEHCAAIGRDPADHRALGPAGDGPGQPGGVRVTGAILHRGRRQPHHLLSLRAPYPQGHRATGWPKRWSRRYKRR